MHLGAIQRDMVERDDPIFFRLKNKNYKVFFGGGSIFPCKGEAYRDPSVQTDTHTYTNIILLYYKD